MAIADVLGAFRELKREGVVRDYMIFGSVAAMVHTEPFFTEDVDIGVAVDSDAEYATVFRHLAAFGRVDGHSVIINGTPAQVFPVDISPIVRDALDHALRRKVEGIVVKVAPPEHLLLEALRVNRPKDRGRVPILDEVVDRRKLAGLFRRLDSDGTLKGRYQRLIG